MNVIFRTRQYSKWCQIPQIFERNIVIDEESMIEKRASAIEEANVTRRHAISESTSSKV